MRSLGICAALALAACSASSTYSDGGLTTEAACDAISTARCNKRQTCEPATLVAEFGDVSTCTAREKVSCIASVNAPGSANTPETLQACTNAFDGLSCAD